MASKPTQRTLEYCRKRGWIPGVVEKWIPQTRRRLDLYGGIDLVVMDGEPGLLGIQATDGSSMSKREKKLNELPQMIEWLRHGLRLEVWGWRKTGKKGKRKLWSLRRTRATLGGDDVAPVIEWNLVEED